MIFGLRRPQYFISHTKSQRSLKTRHRLSCKKVKFAWNACDESLSRIDSSVHLGADHQKSYGGGWGIFEPQEFIFVIKFLV